MEINKDFAFLSTIFPKFRFLGSFEFMAKILIFEKNMNVFLHKYFLAKILIFGQNFYFR